MSWPVPLPAWFWPWLKWYLGKGEYLGDPRNPARRPANAPAKIPQWAWDRLKAHVMSSGFSPYPVTDDVMAFWRRPSVWITHTGHFVPEWLAHEYGAGQYKVVIVPCLRGTALDQIGTQELDDFVRRAKAVGVKVVGSQWGQASTVAEAEVEADAALLAIEKWGFDGWVMNGEKPYEGGGKSGAYCYRFRRRRPNFPLGWSPEARLDLDHKVFQDLKVCYMPQSYPLENGTTMDYVLRWAVQFGYEMKNVVPLIGAYTVNEVRFPAAQYRDPAKAAGVPALCLYTGNQCVDDRVYWLDLL